MEQELTSTFKKIAVIGAGASGCISAKFLADAGFDVTLFDKGEILRSILPTGGGRCNLANAIYDFKELAKYYPRGEKFLYSVFSKFGTEDTIKFFKSIGIDTYIQNDNRIFPVSNSSKDVRTKLLKSIQCNFIKENVIKISKLSGNFGIETNNNEYHFDYVIIATGGHSGYKILDELDLNIIPPTQSLVGLVTKEDFSAIAGVSIKNITAIIDKKEFTGDIIFTHKGVSGPLIYTISSIYARKNTPYLIKLSLTDDFDFQNLLNSNPHKNIKNIISEFIPKALAEHILTNLNIMPDTKAKDINREKRNIIYKNLKEFEINITGKVPDGETVTCGGVDLKEINSKTMESKKYKGLYFCGEILDIDGLCGGFNLQNCWSTGCIAAKSIIESIYS